MLIVINPKEQIDRSKDLSKIMAAETLYSTFIRSEANQTFPLRQTYSATELTSSEDKAVLDKLVKSMEIQTAFTSKKELSDMHLSYDPQTKIMRLCFKLISKMYQSEYVVEYDQAGNLQSDCTPETCYTCLFKKSSTKARMLMALKAHQGFQLFLFLLPRQRPDHQWLQGGSELIKPITVLNIVPHRVCPAQTFPSVARHIVEVLLDMRRSKRLGQAGTTVPEIPLAMKHVGRMEIVQQNLDTCHCGHLMLVVVVSEVFLNLV